MKNGKISMVSRLIMVFIFILVVVMVSAPIGMTATSSEQKKILKIGMVGDMRWPGTVDQMHMDEIYAEMFDKAGGLDIGGEKYHLEFVTYDHASDLSKGKAAINRLIFEDKVKFILAGFAAVTDGFLPITEANKVILITGTPSPVIVSPDIHYGFNAGYLPSTPVVAPRWFFKNHPEHKYIVCAAPDNQTGHMVARDHAAILESVGIKFDIEFFPSNATDLSALGTKVKSLKPDVFESMGGGPLLDALANKAVYASGWRGKFFQSTSSTALAIQQLIPPDVLEGYILPASPFEFDPPLTEMAKEFKTAWIAKYGKYQGEVLGDSYFECLMAALQKAGSLDTEKVAAVISNGLKFESVVSGASQMVPRSDLGNNRTVDSCEIIYMKKIVGGKPELVATIPLEEAITIYADYNNWKKAKTK